MINLISVNLENHGRSEVPHDRDKIFGISLTVFCKIILRLMETRDDEDEEALLLEQLAA